MNCPKCNGLMAYEEFADYFDDTGQLSFNGWRCLICGKLLDPVIDANQKNKVQVFFSKTRRKFNQPLLGV